MTKKATFGTYDAEIQKIVSIMKLITLFFIIGIGCSYASNAVSQTRFSLNINNKTLQEVFVEIEKQGEYVFFYQDNSVDSNRKVSL
ncbi:MAG: hypothetical protein LIP01_07870 [Tannerellaceae bacterium]|nr:hypothetical protein [Tannerellaceae bacterium]